MLRRIALFLTPGTLLLKPTALRAARGMTLIETLVAVTILTVAIVAPMSLTMQSLSSAYYARDQVIAANLAQEAIEAVRSVRDGNTLSIALTPSPVCPGDGLNMHLLCGIPIGADFMVDTRNNTITRCNADGTPECSPLQTDANQTLYGYNTTDPTWINTLFTRVVRAEFVDALQNEIRVTVTVTRAVNGRPSPPVVMSENLYRWVEDGSGI